MKLERNLLLCQAPCALAQHLGALSERHGFLRLAEWDQVSREPGVVLAQDMERDREEVNVGKDEGAFLGVRCLASQQR